MNNQTYNPSIKFLLARILTISDVGIYLEYLRKIEMILYNANINVAEELSVILPHRHEGFSSSSFINFRY